MYCILTILPDGKSVDVATIGCEGVIGIEALFGTEMRAIGDAVVLLPDGGELWHLGGTILQAEIARRGALHLAVSQYAQYVMSQMALTAACNLAHRVHERCARWLLGACDRLRHPTLRITHEVLAMMLGTQRPTVTVVAKGLQEAGLIAYTHGQLTIRDRRRLKAAACPCYGSLRSNFDQLLASYRREQRQ